MSAAAGDGSGLICAECTIDNDPRAWCECINGRQCRGPCRHRAHGPAECPFRTAWVPVPRDARDVQNGDVIQLRTGELMIVTASGSHPDVAGEPAWRIDLIGLNVPGGTTTQTVMPVSYPVPVLVPYAERALALQLNARVIGHGQADPRTA